MPPLSRKARRKLAKSNKSEEDTADPAIHPAEPVSAELTVENPTSAEPGSVEPTVENQAPVEPVSAEPTIENPAAEHVSAESTVEIPDSAEPVSAERISEVLRRGRPRGRSVDALTSRGRKLDIIPAQHRSHSVEATTVGITPTVPHIQVDTDSFDRGQSDPFQKTSSGNPELYDPIQPFHKVLLRVGDLVVASQLRSDDPQHVLASLSFRRPQNTRGFVEICVDFKVNVDPRNPYARRSVSAVVRIPARSILTFNYIELPQNSTLQGDALWADAGGLTDRNGRLCKLAKCSITTQNIYIVSPPLTTSSITSDSALVILQSFLAKLREHNAPLRIDMVVRCLGDDYHSSTLSADTFNPCTSMTTREANEFSNVMLSDITRDPAARWCKDSPHQHALAMGNILAFADRPQVAIAAHQLVFDDQLTKSIPMVYCSAYDEDFKKQVLTELHDTQFKMKVICNKYSQNFAPRAEASYDSAEATYIAFIPMDTKAYQPTVGTSLLVCMTSNEDAAEDQQTQDSAEVVAEAQVEEVQAADFEQIESTTHNQQTQDSAEIVAGAQVEEVQAAESEQTESTTHNQQAQDCAEVVAEAQVEEVQAADSEQTESTTHNQQTQDGAEVVSEDQVVEGDCLQGDEETIEQLNDREFGNEEAVDVFVEPADRVENEMHWPAEVIANLPFTPPGHLTIMLLRRRQPHWQGDGERPFVTSSIPVLNATLTEDCSELVKIILSKECPQIACTVIEPYSNQVHKDCVRSTQNLSKSDNPRKQLLAEALLCHDPSNNGLPRVNVNTLKGTSTIDITSKYDPVRRKLVQHYDPSQLKFVQHLSDCSQVVIGDAIYGSGKTTIGIDIAVQTVSNPDVKNQILYVTESNKGVDDVVLRMLKKLETHAIEGKKVCRMLNFADEKEDFLLNYSTAPSNHFASKEELDMYAQQTQSMIAELRVSAALLSSVQKYKKEHQKRDKRRVLTDLILSGHAAKELQTSRWVNLRGNLALLAEDGWTGLNPLTRSSIKQEVRTLLLETLRSMDIVVCTVATAAKVNFVANFHPCIALVDEAGRISEFKLNIIFGNWDPQAYIILGDWHQTRPFLESAARENDEPPFINPFQNTGLVSGLERLVKVGWEHVPINIQHRCKGDIGQFPSSYFYDSAKQAALSADERKMVNEVRDWVHDELKVPSKTNRFVINVMNSRSKKEEGGTSSFNEIEASEIIQTVLAHRAKFPGRSVCVLTFHKAMASYIADKLSNLPGVQVLDGNEHTSDLSVLNVDAAQGMEWDTVFLALTRTRGLKFMADEKRLLVALTRARICLGVFLNDSLFEGASNQKNALWYFYNDSVQKNHVKHVAGGELTAPLHIQCMKCGRLGHKASACPNEEADKCRECKKNNDPRMFDHVSDRHCPCPIYGIAPFCVECHSQGETERARTHTKENCQWKPKFCHDCRVQGHSRSSCPYRQCRVCFAWGHTQNSCVLEVMCISCYTRGHFGKDCPNKRKGRVAAAVQQQEKANYQKWEYLRRGGNWEEAAEFGESPLIGSRTPGKIGTQTQNDAGNVENAENTENDWSGGNDEGAW